MSWSWSWRRCLEHQLKQFNLLYTNRILLSKCVTCLLMMNNNEELCYSWHITALICDSMMLTLRLCFVASVSVSVLVLRVAVLLTTLVMAVEILWSCSSRFPLVEKVLRWPRTVGVKGAFYARCRLKSTRHVPHFRQFGATNNWRFQSTCSMMLTLQFALQCSAIVRVCRL